MASIVPARYWNPSTSETLQPESATLGSQAGPASSNASAGSSVPSLLHPITGTGSQDDLLAQPNVLGNVEPDAGQAGPGDQSRPPAPVVPDEELDPPNVEPPNQDDDPEDAPDQAILEGRPGRFQRGVPNGELHAPPRPRFRKEWRSWKIKYPWLSFVLIITILLIATITTLDLISRRNNGFAPLTNAPGFLARDPALERGIWGQGFFYTSVPAFIMTLYGTMWQSTVSAFADRQPYVDLKKERGRSAKSTIMLDYKTNPFLWAYVPAFRNKHYLLSLCLLTSMLLSLGVVPLVAFLLTTDSFVLSAALPVSILNRFDPGMVFPDPPDLRLSLNSAAVMRLQDGRGPPWTDGEFAFPNFLPVTNMGEGNATLETTAYSSTIDCQYMPESNYTKSVILPGTPGYPSRVTRIEIKANDRGCEIAGQIDVTTVSEFPDFPDMPALNAPQNVLRVWSTQTCSAGSGWTRFSILTARFVNSTTTGITNFSLISCMPSYQMTLGTLVATVGPSSQPSLQSFTPHESNMTIFRSDVLAKFFETNLPDFNCFDKLRNIDADEFMRNVYDIATRRLSDSPLLPEAIIDAASTLWSTTFAVLASTELFNSSSPPVNGTANGTAIYSSETSRLVVVSPVAYIILSILAVVVLLNACLFFYANQESILLEEPVGLVSAAGILYKSEVSGMVDELVKEQTFDGRVTAAIKERDKLMKDRYHFDDQEGRILRYEPDGIARELRRGIQMHG